jgi:hypothetical protein
VETLLKQIWDSVDYSKAGGAPIGAVQQIRVVYTKIFATGRFMSTCRHCNKKYEDDKTWTIFKTHFVVAYRQFKQMRYE